MKQNLKSYAYKQSEGYAALLGRRARKLRFFREARCAGALSPHYEAECLMACLLENEPTSYYAWQG